jgi:hypothetical protein
MQEWRSHPVTERLLEILRKGYASNKASLQAQLWAQGECDPATLGRVKAQEELLEDLMESTHEEWNDWAKAFER